MATMEDLPADLRAKMSKPAPTGPIAPLAGPTGRRFIGSATKEYAGEQAAQLAQKAPDADGVPDDKATPSSELRTCPRCKVSTIEDNNFCFNCGFDNKRQRAADALGIKITDEDVQDYLFKGHIVKSVPFMEKHTLTFKTSQSGEVDEADELTEKHFKERRPTDLEWLNYRAKVLIAFGWVKLDGSSIGQSPKERLEYIQQHGSQLIELVGKKYNLFTTAIGEVLNADTLGK